MSNPAWRGTALVSVSETLAHPGIRVPSQLQRTYLTEALVERTPKEQEQYNYSRTLSYNLGYSPDEDAAVIRSPSIDWDETGTMTTDMEMTDAMTGFTLDSLADNREVLYSRTGMSLGPHPGTFPKITNSNGVGQAQEKQRSELVHILGHVVGCQSLPIPKGRHGEVGTTMPVLPYRHPC